MYLHGRTETGRSLSSESLAFVQSFDDDNVLVSVLPSSLMEPMTEHFVV
jgi:Choline/Carnitine o-acyltransferase